MTFRIISLRGKRGTLTWRSSLADAMDEVEERAAELTRHGDRVTLSLDRDVEPILEVAGG